MILPQVPRDHFIGLWVSPTHEPEIAIIGRAQDGEWWEKAIYAGDQGEVGVPILLEPSLLWPKEEEAEEEIEVAA